MYESFDIRLLLVLRTVNRLWKLFRMMGMFLCSRRRRIFVHIPQERNNAADFLAYLDFLAYQTSCEGISHRDWRLPPLMIIASLCVDAVTYFFIFLVFLL